MPTITKIKQQKRSPNRRSVFLDGRFAFGCGVNVVARFRLRVGMSISGEQLRRIEQEELRQECFDAAIRALQRRLHSAAELSRKLAGKGWTKTVVSEVLSDLARLGYLDDRRFATVKAQASATHKHQGKRRARIELMRAGVASTVADAALDDVYESTDTLAVARQLVEKQLPRLRRLEPPVARRRLAGMLLRRGFDYDEIRSVIDGALP